MSLRVVILLNWAEVAHIYPLSVLWVFLKLKPRFIAATREADHFDIFIGLAQREALFAKFLIHRLYKKLFHRLNSWVNFFFGAAAFEMIVRRVIMEARPTLHLVENVSFGIPEGHLTKVLTLLLETSFTHFVTNPSRLLNCGWFLGVCIAKALLTIGESWHSWATRLALGFGLTTRLTTLLQILGVRSWRKWVHL